MTQLVWGAAGERRFEAGVDRGVLYLPGEAGVAWNGLKSVKEAPTGGEPQPYYLDGMKYANVAASEEFNASLEAFAAPPQFALCDGSVILAAGLMATGQPRKPFGLSYRTRVGNDINGIDGGYKIHLVYNALAAPASRDNNTTSNAISPLSLAWSISTRPPRMLGFKPTAHFVVNTRDTDPTKLEALELAIYGGPATTPSLPSQTDVIDILS